MPPLRHVERDALEHQDDVIVDHLDIVDRQDHVRFAAAAAFVWNGDVSFDFTPGNGPLSAGAGRGVVTHSPYDDLSQGSLRFGHGWFLDT